MKLMENRRFAVLTAIAAFIVFIFIWGTFSLGQHKSVPTENQYQYTPEPKITASVERVDIQDLTNRLLNEVKYDTTLELIDSSLAKGMLNLSEDSVMELYMGEGTYADELLVVRSASEAAAKADQKAVEEHLKEMRDSFEDYIPEEADKIGQAVIIRCGCYVIACVTSDVEHAQDMIVEAFQQ